MRITKRQLAARHAASTDPTRYNLHGVLIESDGAAIATNGHFLIHVTGSADAVGEGEPELRETIAALGTVDAMRKDIAKSSGAEIDADATNANGQIHYTIDGFNGQSARIGERIDGEYPAYRQVLPKGDPTVAIGINFAYLDAIHKALKEFYAGEKKGTIPARVEFFGPPDGMSMQPIRVTAENLEGETFTAVLMPMRL